MCPGLWPHPPPQDWKIKSARAVGALEKDLKIMHILEYSRFSSNAHAKESPTTLHRQTL